MKFKFEAIHLLDRLSADLSGLRPTHIPNIGWLTFVRRALGISLQTIGEGAGVTAQAIFAFELSERKGTLQMAKLASLADLLRCQLQYAPYWGNPAIDQRLAEVVAQQGPFAFDDESEPPFPAYMATSSMPRGVWLKRMRILLGYSQADVAKQPKMTQQAIDQLERAESIGTISLKSLRKVAAAMGCEMVYFLANNPAEAPSFLRRFYSDK